jgi:hypothetical protein
MSWERNSYKIVASLWERALSEPFNVHGSEKSKRCMPMMQAGPTFVNTQRNHKGAIVRTTHLGSSATRPFACNSPAGTIARTVLEEGLRPYPFE